MTDGAPEPTGRVLDVTPPEESVREELVERVLQRLLDDAERCEGELDRADVNREYFRRNLTGLECTWIELRLKANEVHVTEHDDDGADSNDDEDEVTRAIGQSGIRLGSAVYLTEAEERECGRRIQLALRLVEEGGSGDANYDARVQRDAEAARKRFVESNLRYVWKLVSQKRRRQHLATEDLFQEGVVGLMKASDYYNPEMGFRFKTYATWWIQQSIQRAIGDRDRTVRLPIHLQEKESKIRRAESRLAGTLGRTPSQEELAKALGIDPARLAKLLWRVHATNCLEADAPISDDVSLISVKADDEATSAFDVVADRELKTRFNELLLELSAREERVLRMRFGFNGGRDHTLDAVGQTFGLTRERIRQIESKALRKLKHPVRSKRLLGFVD